VFQIEIMSPELLKEKHLLVERLGVLFEKKEALAPMAARIFAFVVLTGRQGVTFEDLLQGLCASKSTISTHLNHLHDLKKLEYFTKPGDRKKYYVVNQDSIRQHIDEMIATWDEQRELHLEMKAFKNKVNLLSTDLEPPFEMDFHDNYIDFLEQAIKSLNKLKDAINLKLTQSSHNYGH